MDLMISFLSALNSVTPLGIVVLLALVLFYQAKNNKTATNAATTLQTMRGNDLHELPEMAAVLRRIEISQEKNFATLLTVLARTPQCAAYRPLEK